MARLLEELSQYSMQLIHQPGVKHVNADALSRLPDKLKYCDGYKAGVPLQNLPYGGCAFCTRAFRKWGEIERTVDDVTSLSVRALSIAVVDPELV